MNQIFVSSAQKELQADRYAVRYFMHGNPLLGQFFRVFLFEDLPTQEIDASNPTKTRHGARKMLSLEHDPRTTETDDPVPCPRFFMTDFL